MKIMVHSSTWCAQRTCPEQREGLVCRVPDLHALEYTNTLKQGKIHTVQAPWREPEYQLL